MVTDVKPEQPENARSPIDVTEFGIDIKVNPSQFINAYFFISVISLGITRFVISVPFSFR